LIVHDPADALRTLADQLRAESSVIVGHVVDPPAAEPALGSLAAAGRRTAAAPGEYAVVVEAVREGYLLHYANSRLLAAVDPDLSLLAGDYLYALGLQRLAALGDLAAVRELSDLIGISAQLQAEGRDGSSGKALWLGCVAAIACGASTAHEGAKAALRERRSGAAAALVDAARDAAGDARLGEALEGAAQAIDFAAPSG
jgi:hypothetical protein